MRFITFSYRGQIRAGVILSGSDQKNDKVLDLAHPACMDCLGGTKPDLLNLIEIGLELVAQKISTILDLPDEAILALSHVDLLAPLPNPPRIIGAAHNYRCALAEREMKPPEAPVFFDKHVSTVVAPDAKVILPANAGGVTYEAELAVVIGKPAWKVSPAEAVQHVAGYTLFNDISASEIIKADGGFERGKNFPTFGPMGPWLATRDEIDPVPGLRVTLEIDGVLRQDGSTADILFSAAEMISRLSQEKVLASGTVIATGTPAGVAPVQNPPTWLEHGTVMTVAIAGLGTLSNPVESEASSHAA